MTAVLVILAILAFLFMLIYASEDKGKPVIICLALVIALGIPAVFSAQNDLRNQQIEYKQRVKNHEYVQVRTYIEGIYKDKIATDKGTFIINEDSKFSDVSKLKLDQAILVTYVEGISYDTLIDIVPYQ